MTTETTPTAPAAEPVTADAITPLDMPTPTAPTPAAAQDNAQEAAQAPAAPTPAADADAEKDSAGVPFDPARHLAKKNPHSGRWMPRGGRKPKPKTPAGAAPADPAQTALPFTPAETYIPAQDTPPAADQDKAQEPAQDKTNEPAQAAPAAGNGADHTEAAGEMGSHALQFGAGLVSGLPEEFTATNPEHKKLAEAFACFFRSLGWEKGSPFLLLFLTAGAWIISRCRRPAVAAAIREKIKFARAENVTPAPEPGQPEPTRAAPNVTAQPYDLPRHIPPLAAP